MKIEIVEKANTILEEIKELKKYKDYLKNSQKHTVHFAICQHYGSESNKIRINRDHNDRFILLVEQIILELETILANI